jgi:hypothetical protein
MLRTLCIAAFIAFAPAAHATSAEQMEANKKAVAEFYEFEAGRPRLLGARVMWRGSGGSGHLAAIRVSDVGETCQRSPASTRTSPACRVKVPNAEDRSLRGFLGRVAL